MQKTTHQTSSSHHTPRFHHTPRYHLTSYSTPHIKLATTPPPLHTPSTALAIQRALCGDIPRATDGDAAWRGEIPAKPPVRTAAVAQHRAGFPKRPRESRHLPPLSVPKRGKQGGVGAACPLAIGGEIERAQKRAGKKRSESSGGGERQKRSGAELSRRVWKALVWLKARVKRRGRGAVRSRRAVRRT